MDLEYVDSLAELVSRSRVTEVTVRRGERTVTVRRAAGDAVPVAAPALEPTDLRPAPRLETSLPVPVSGETALVPVNGNGAEAESVLEIVTAHRVGVFHRAAADEGDPLIRIGDWAAAKQQLGAIQSMRLFDEIDSPVSGRVVGIFVADGEPVEYGQALFHIEVEPGPEVLAEGEPQ